MLQWRDKYKVGVEKAVQMSCPASTALRSSEISTQKGFNFARWGEEAGLGLHQGQQKSTFSTQKDGGRHHPATFVGKVAQPSSEWRRVCADAHTSCPTHSERKLWLWQGWRRVWWPTEAEQRSDGWPLLSPSRHGPRWLRACGGWLHQPCRRDENLPVLGNGPDFQRRRQSHVPSFQLSLQPPREYDQSMGVTLHWFSD